MKNFVINKYLIGEFLKSFLNVLLIFCCAGLVMNLFEEINYFRKYDIGMGLPIQLSLMIIPSIIINMLPFILFLSSMFSTTFSSITYNARASCCHRRRQKVGARITTLMSTSMSRPSFFSFFSFFNFFSFFSFFSPVV